MNESLFSLAVFLLFMFIFQVQARQNHLSIEIQLEEIFSGEWIDPKDKKVFCSYYKDDAIKAFQKAPIYVSNKRVLLSSIILSDHLSNGSNTEYGFLEKIIRIYLNHTDSNYHEEDVSMRVEELLSIKERVRENADRVNWSIFEKWNYHIKPEENHGASYKAGEMIYDALCPELE